MNVLDILLERTIETPETLLYLIMLGAICTEQMANECHDTKVEYRARYIRNIIEEIGKEFIKNE